ncbi:MAG: tetratricopeptide repeat protein [Bacteroidetes bacterium]|jgi:antitoxin component YwqK of YwqJK toxin-antitoxin module/Tfp pilus assembly protein PilF|nr:tetratricopeptide repeat protein [Bacteroidota bacterium]
MTNKNPLFALVVLFSVITHISFAQQAVQDPELIDTRDVLLQGDIFQYQGRYSKAIPLYKKISRNDSLYYRAQFEMAKCYLNEKEDSMCWVVAVRGTELKSRIDADFYNIGGIALKEMKKYDAAIELLDKGISMYPYMYLLHYNKGLVYYNMKKYAEAQKAFQSAITVNPYHASSHFMLGKSAIEQGRVIPAILSFEFYLLVDPTSDRALKVVTQLEDIMGGNYDVDPDVEVERSESGDGCFDDLLQVIESKAALSETYQNKTKINLKMVKQRQILFEKLKYQEGTNNWWMDYYVPYFVDIQKNNHWVSYAHYTLMGIQNESVRKGVKKNKKKITAFAKWAGKEIIERTKHPAFEELKDKTGKWDIFYYENNIVGGVGHQDDKGEPVGEWIYFHSRSGLVKGKGSFNAMNKRDGEWIWYHDNGQIQEKENYKNGLREGEFISYYDNGNIQTKGNYVNDKLDGPYEKYSLSGIMTEKGSFKADKTDGQIVLYHVNGKVSVDGSYKMGKIDGPLKQYDKFGVLRREIMFSVDKRNGAYKEFDHNNKLITEGEYRNGDEFGKWKYYYNDGSLRMEGVFGSGGKKEGLWRELYRNGTVAEETNYKAGNLEGVQITYTKNGKKVSERKYKADALVAVTFWNEAGKELGKFDIVGRTTVTEYYENGNRAAEGDYVNGKKSGEWNTYHPVSGWRTTKEEYYQGELDGTRKEYFPNGKVRSQLNFKNGSRRGLLKAFYSNGILETEGWLIGDEREGNWYSYNERGIMTSHNYYVEDEEVGYQVGFDHRGRKREEVEVKQGMVWSRTEFDTTGQVRVKWLSDKGTGTFIAKHTSGTDEMRFNYEKGYLQGSLYRGTYYGKPTLETQFEYGEQKGLRKEYYAMSGNLYFESQYERGVKHGNSKGYYDNGNLRWDENYDYGDQEGMQKYYHDNGMIARELPYEEDDINGEARYYNLAGKLAYIRYYRDGYLTDIAPVDAEGKAGAKISLEQEDVTIRIVLPDSSKFVEGAFKNGRQHGKWITYYPDGKIYKEENYNYGDLEGEVKWYHPNGQLWKQLNYFADRLEGEQKFFYSHGTLEHTEYWLLDDAFGVWIYYDNDKGLPRKLVKFYDDKILYDKTLDGKN